MLRLIKVQIYNPGNVWELFESKGPFTLAILAMIFAAILSAISGAISNRLGIASSLHWRFEIASKSRLGSQQKSPQNALENRSKNRQCKRALNRVSNIECIKSRESGQILLPKCAGFSRDVTPFFFRFFLYRKMSMQSDCIALKTRFTNCVQWTVVAWLSIPCSTLLVGLSCSLAQKIAALHSSRLGNELTASFWTLGSLLFAARKMRS